MRERERETDREREARGCVECKAKLALQLSLFYNDRVHCPYLFTIPIQLEEKQGGSRSRERGAVNPLTPSRTPSRLNSSLAA
jgi:hypothetical protein